jgi:hypothetical protein
MLQCGEWALYTTLLLLAFDDGVENWRLTSLSIFWLKLRGLGERRA